MCCHLQKNRPNSQKDRRLIKTGRQAGQTFGVRDVGHREEKNHVTFHFHSRLTGGFKPFLWFHLLLTAPGFLWFLLPSHPFLAYHSLKLFLLWLCSVGDLPYLPLSTWTTSRWAEQGSSPCRLVLLCPPLPPLWDWKETELLPPLGLDHGNPPPAHVTHTEAWLNLHRLKCHWTWMYSPLSNTWLLIQSPLVWSTGFNFGRVDSGLATWDLHLEKANPLVFSSDTHPQHRTGRAQTKLCQSWLHWQWNQSSPTHFLGFLFPIPLFWSSCCTVCKGLKFSNLLSTLTSLHSRFLECNFKLDFMKERPIYGTPHPKAVTLSIRLWDPNECLKKNKHVTAHRALEQSSFSFSIFFFFPFFFNFYSVGGVSKEREGQPSSQRRKRKINIFWFCLAFQTSQALEHVSNFQWNSFVSQYKHPSGGCCHWFLFLNWGLIQLPLKPAGFSLLFFSGPFGPLVAENQLCPRDLACLN